MASKYILCAESTADDDGLFWAANIDVLEMIEVIERNVFDNAGHWGGFKQIDGTASLRAANKSNIIVVDTKTVERLYKICCEADEGFNLEYYQHYYQQLMDGISFSAKELKYVKTIEPSFESQATITGELNGHKIHVVPDHPVVKAYCANRRYIVQVTVTEATDEHKAHTKQFNVMWHNAIQITDDIHDPQSLHGFNFTLDEFQDWLRANVDSGMMIQTCEDGVGLGAVMAEAGDRYFLRHWVEAEQCYKISPRKDIKMPW